MSADLAVVPAAPATVGRTVGVGRHRYPLLLPKLADPRLHVAGILLSIQVLGQVGIRWDLSIAQILLSMGTCAVIEVAMRFHLDRVVAWPASALLTGNGVALLLRVPGTEHGDWWSLNGWQIYVAIAALSLLSKYVIRFEGRHLFNPSNLGLAVGFLILGSSVADPQDLWWGPISPAIVATLLLIVAGGVLVTVRNGLFGTAASFFVTFLVGTGVLATRGHCIQARWSAEPVCGGSYWWTLLSSPEILIFLFFMITDPRTIPATRTGRIVHGTAVGALATWMVAPQTTEFATKVSLLVALVFVCAARPLIDRRLGARTFRDLVPPTGGRRVLLGVGGPLLFAASVVLLGAAARPLPESPSSIAVPSSGQPRPAVELTADAVPTPVMDPSIRRMQPPVTEADVERLSRSLLESLVIEADARRTRDVEVAATAVGGARLIDLTAEVDAAASSGTPLEVRRYDARELEFSLYRDPARPQSFPQIAVRLVGSVEAAAAPPGASADELDWQAARPVDQTLLIADDGANAIIVGALDSP